MQIYPIDIDWTAATENLYTTGAGRFDGGVGIGVGPSASYPIRVEASSSDSKTIRFRNTSTGDAALSLFAGASWILGIDNSDSDKFKISQHSTELETNTWLAITTAGVIDASGLSIFTQTNWRYLSGDGTADVGLSIDIPATAGNHFFYGYGGTEHHYFGADTSPRVEITDDGIINSAAINCAELTIANGSSINLQEAITFTGATTENLIEMPDNLANALSFMEGANAYLTFVTTNGSEAINVNKNLALLASTSTVGQITQGGEILLHTLGTGNVFLGYQAGNLTAAGQIGNVGIGYQALNALTSGDDNVGVGYQALLLAATTTRNIAIGKNALAAMTGGTTNVGIGYQALLNCTANNNTAIGSQALQATTTGTQNFALGTFTLRYLTGVQSGNIGIGYAAGRYHGAGADQLTGATDCIYIGSLIRAAANNPNNEIIIGASVTGNGSNTVTIGTANTTANYLMGTLLITDKLILTQTDGNEYIDSLADGYMDYQATTAHRFRITAAQADVRFEFIGTDATGILFWDESAELWEWSHPMQIVKNSGTAPFFKINTTLSGPANEVYFETNWDSGGASTGPIRARLESMQSIGKVGTFTNHPFQLVRNDVTALAIDVSGNIDIGDIANNDYVRIDGVNGNLSFAGSSGFYPRFLTQAAEPAAGTGATQCDTSEMVIWKDSDDSKVYACFNDGGTVKTVELA